MWHVVVSKQNKGKNLEFKCFPDGTKSRGSQTLYEVYGNYEFPLKTGSKLELVLQENDEAKFYKCVGRDFMNNIVSSQLYVVTTEGKFITYHGTGMRLCLVIIQHCILFWASSVPLLVKVG
jgi:hypothetical protein